MTVADRGRSPRSAVRLQTQAIAVTDHTRVVRYGHPRPTTQGDAISALRIHVTALHLQLRTATDIQLQGRCIDRLKPGARVELIAVDRRGGVDRSLALHDGQRLGNRASQQEYR
ncbi:hypothetical protein D3C79_794240 [compost metagenome]